MNITKIKSETTYTEQAGHVDLQINSKKVRYNYWRKQDSEMSDYDEENAVRVLEGAELTDEEKDEITNWIDENGVD